MVKNNRQLTRTAREIQKQEGTRYTEALVIARSREGQEDKPVFQLGKRAGVKMQLTVSEDRLPYANVDLPVYSQIELPDGVIVMAYDFGNPGKYTYKDGVERSSWVHPVYYPASGDQKWDEEDASHLITSEQQEALEHADAIAYGFFSDVVQDELSKTWDEVQGLTREELIQLVKARVASL